MRIPLLFPNYRAPGPGVSKNGPKKKALFRFFGIYFRKFWKLIQLSLLHTLFALPVVTYGLAEVGAARVTRGYVRGKPTFIWSDFWKAVKGSWKQALPLGFINLAVQALLLFNIFYYSENMVMMVIAIAMFIVFTFMRFYIPLLIATFHMSLKQLYKNALILAFAGMWRNLLIAFVEMPFYVLVYMIIFSGNPFWMTLTLMIYLLFVPSFHALLTQFAIFPLVKRTIIDPYYAKKAPGEDASVRREVGVEPEEEDKTKDIVFRDAGKTEEYLREKAARANALPHQYSEKELRGFKSKTRQNEDEDGTI